MNAKGALTKAVVYQVPAKVTVEDMPSQIVSHELPLAEAPDAYDEFGKRVDGYTKVLLKP